MVEQRQERKAQTPLSAACGKQSQGHGARSTDTWMHPESCRNMIVVAHIKPFLGRPLHRHAANDAWVEQYHRMEEKESAACTQSRRRGLGKKLHHTLLLFYPVLFTLPASATLLRMQCFYRTCQSHAVPTPSAQCSCCSNMHGDRSLHKLTEGDVSVRSVCSSFGWQLPWPAA